MRLRDSPILEIELLLTLGVPLQNTKGAGSPEAERTYGRARELCRRAGEAAPLFSAL